MLRKYRILLVLFVLLLSTVLVYLYIRKEQRLYPITFSIPDEKIVRYIPRKEKLISSLIPGKRETYIYNTEKEYYNEYRKSYFALTTKKAGWDCMRHYEIMANGCIPYFPDIENSPKNTMALLPKQLILEGNRLYKRLENKNINDLTAADIDECNTQITKILEYTRNNLTTRDLASYVLEKAKCKDASKILFLSGYIKTDYLRCVTLHGFKQLMGPRCHDYPKIPHLYKSHGMNLNAMYGKGMSYSGMLDQSLHDNVLDETVERDIKNHYYDIVIYGSYHRGMPFYDLVSKNYSPDKVILLCGEDFHKCNHNDWLKRGHTVFVREL
jgi:hypothetical protein